MSTTIMRDLYLDLDDVRDARLLSWAEVAIEAGVDEGAFAALLKGVALSKCTMEKIHDWLAKH